MQVIVAHPDFRMIVLANRPGFPFLGNDFFGALGEGRSIRGGGIIGALKL